MDRDRQHLGWTSWRECSEYDQWGVHDVSEKMLQNSSCGEPKSIRWKFWAAGASFATHYRRSFQSIDINFGSFYFSPQISHIELVMGTATNFVTLTQSQSLNSSKDFRHYDRKADCLQNIVSCATCYIVPMWVSFHVPISALNLIPHFPIGSFHLTAENNFKYKSMLTNEYFKITTSIHNDFHVTLDTVGISITVPSHLRNKGKRMKNENKLNDLF